VLGSFTEIFASSFFSALHFWKAKDHVVLKKSHEHVAADESRGITEHFALDCRRTRHHACEKVNKNLAEIFATS
jgi:hypothetical protein